MPVSFCSGIPPIGPCQRKPANLLVAALGATLERVRNLAQTIQAVYDSEIGVTITTMLWNGGFDFALCSSVRNKMPVPEAVWHTVDRADQLADAIHTAVLAELPQSAYAQRTRIH